MESRKHLRIHLTGIVQGVGMRPHVYRMARAADVTGWVLNAGDGVRIEAHGMPEQLDAFVRSLNAQAPAAARIEGVTTEPLAWDDDRPVPSDFSIVASADTTGRTTLVSPDLATCPDCVRELFDPADRRYHYPFINCTNCGPRFTIIRRLPYDRAQTSMDAFPMCPECAAEYADPSNRRFHAQPDACFACGPHLTWATRASLAESPAPAATGRNRAESDTIVDAAADLIAGGGVLAVKGLGGFHLACNAQDPAAVETLRRRKRRPRKPLAIMARSLEDAALVACVEDDEVASLLTEAIRPIVLLPLRRHARSPLAPGVTCGLAELGIMLPYTPLQHLLMAACHARGIDYLVMTSGNVSGSPIETDDARACERLLASGLADALLGNDRAILTRYDDSVVRPAADMGATAAQMIRRARGYAPRPLPLPGATRAQARTADAASAPCILACGAQQKAVLAYTRREEDGRTSCLMSQHVGDLDNAETLSAWHEARERMADLFALTPTALACDAHPNYASSQWARQEAAAQHLPLVEVQHHHAHIAAALAEHRAVPASGSTPSPIGAPAAQAPVLGLAFDGTGAGTDGTVWGGELLAATLRGYARLGHLRSWRLPGGSAAVRDPRRNALALLMELGLEEHPAAQALRASLGPQACRTLAVMTERELNSPRTSSMGRLFDALAALTGICPQASYDGEPAIRFESACSLLAQTSLAEAADPRYRMVIHTRACEHKPQTLARMQRVGEAPVPQELVLDPYNLVKAVLDDCVASVPLARIALRAHAAVALGAADLVHASAALLPAAACEWDVVCSGGVWMNQTLTRLTQQALDALRPGTGARIIVSRDVPSNDGGIAYGQAAVALARLNQSGGDVERP